MIKALLLVPALTGLLVVKGPVDPYGGETLQLTIHAFADYSSSSLLAEKSEEMRNSGERGWLTGHVFLEIKNISGGLVQVGHVSLSNNQYTTIGCWPEPKTGLYLNPNDGNFYYTQNGAIWYNNEAYDTAGWSTKESYSLSTTINALSTQTLSAYLLNGSNSYWDLLTHTCANVAVEIWNTVVVPTSLHLSPGLSYWPSSVKEAIATKTGYATNASYHVGTTHGYIDSSNSLFVSA